jgi:D-alanyl-D-alanine carboxypeptidase-like protein/putative peptidoglycan binding protein
MPRSQNGYSANNIALTLTKLIPGTRRQIRLRRGNPGWLLRHLAAWFDDHVENIEVGILDDWGYAERTIRGSSTDLSNHASGTAEDLNATKHPLGVRGTFSRAETEAIRRQLRKYVGCIRWGGDYSGRPDEMHFEIDRGRAACAAVAAVLKAAGAARKVVTKVLPVIDVSNVRYQARHGGPDRNAAVKRIQRRLNARLGTRIDVDGRFGPVTREAYKDFQLSQGYTGNAADGIPGRASLHVLMHRIKIRK